MHYSKRHMLPMKVWLALFCLIVLTSCSESVSVPEPFSHDEATARLELLKLAPVGSDVRLALPALQARGFKCSWSRQAEFYSVVGRHDYLYCDFEDAGFPVTRRWQLALIHRSFVVTDARFGIGLTGP